VADLELLTIKIQQMTIESTENKQQTNQPLLIASVSGSISVTKHTGINQVHISSKSNFFDGYLIIKDDGEKLTFRKPSIDYRGKIYKPKYYKNSKIFITAIVSEMPLGKFDFDVNESNEDELVVYYR